VNVVSFEAFESAITSPVLKSVARHWQDVRGTRTMPGWSAIRPSRIADELAIIWSYSCDRAAGAFTGRLAGDQIEQRLGRSIKGVPMEQLYPASDFQRLFARSKRVVCGPRLYCGKGIVHSAGDRSCYGERIIMPLASNGVHADGILGATDFLLLLTLDGEMLPESDNWFSL
jgi:hypothetical protein